MEVSQDFYVLRPGNELGSKICLTASSRSSEVVVIVGSMIYVQHYVGLLNSLPNI